MNAKNPAINKIADISRKSQSANSTAVILAGVGSNGMVSSALAPPACPRHLSHMSHIPCASSLVPALQPWTWFDAEGSTAGLCVAKPEACCAGVGDLAFLLS